ncbi:MAG: DUF2779 domain-containing protein [Gammaproteobacteria bacterium]|nr:DUF2779 domain-containing protein [Gammaproteobacteria bacterium]
MASIYPSLSKSRVISAWQCAKKLYLEKHHPELADVSARTESLFATGHQVGDMAKQLYGNADAIEIQFNRRTELMVRQTRGLIARGVEVPLFEATFQHDNVLVRVDVLLPDGEGWRAIEVKASTSVKDYHVLDCAIQDWVMRGSGLKVTGISLAHVDNQFVYSGDGHYDGLLTEVDLTDEIRTVEPAVDDLVDKARLAATGPLPGVQVGAQCRKPFECQFLLHCWPTQSKYPIIGLGGNTKKLAEYAARGYADIRDVPADNITAETQARIHRVTQSGRPEILDGARETLAALAYPRYYLDFETIAPAVPFWKSTRPYAAVPVQWSVHIDDGAGDGRLETMRHEEFLDLSGAAPMRSLAKALIESLGSDGPVLMYTRYEEQVIDVLIDLFPDLAAPLQAIIDRLFDLYPVVKLNYYHPDMLGSWSIKAVLPTMVPTMDYSRLDGIKEGTAASDGFIEAISDATSPERKAELERQLRRYCRFDTEAMVEIVRFFCST